MDDATPPISIDGLRNNISVRVVETSLRNVAREVGMSPTGLEKFLEGSQPYTSVRGKLYEWWARAGGQPSEEVSPELAETALEWLVRDLPPRQRAAAAERVLLELREAHRREDVPAPVWLSALLERPGAEARDSSARGA